MIDPDMAMAYLGFVEARHEAWEARQRGEDQPWTDDPIVNSRKFTNVYRVLDYGSQWLVRELLDPELEPVEILARCFLYRHTNLPSAWEAYRESRENYPLLADLDDLRTFWQAYRASGYKAFSSAYMVYPQSSEKGTDKVASVIALTQQLAVNGSFEAFLSASNQPERFAALRRNKGVADFMSMQILTDYGYSAQCGEDREDEFVVPGPGARRGAAHLASWDSRVVIDWAMEAVHASPGCPLLWYNEDVYRPRRPSLMDIQNTLCEFSKYVRFMSRPSREQPYVPAHPGVQSDPVLPDHWNR